MIAMLVAAGLILIVLYTMCRMVHTAFFSKLLKIPGLPFGPLYGNVRESMEGESMASSIRWVKKFGVMVRFYNLFGREQVLIADPEAIRYVLVTNSTNFYREPSEALRVLIPEGLFSLEGPLHRSSRKLLNPVFNTSAVKSFILLFHRTASKLITKMEDLVGSASSAKLNMQMLMKSVTMDVIGQAAFDHDLQALENPDNDLVSSLRTLITAQKRSLFSGLPFYRSLPLKSNIKYKEATQIVDKFCLDIITDRREQPSTESNLLTKLISARFEGDGSGLSDKALRDHMVSFMLAGYETSSATLAWLLLELARNPLVQQQLYDELVTAEDYHNIQGEQLEALKYLDACLKETMRLYPAASSLVRKSLRDDIINGYEIPSGTDVILHLGAMMRTCVDDGESFNPNRYLTSEMESIKWLPFGIGSHACIGNKFAMMEMKLITLYLIRNFEFSAVPGLVIHRKRAVAMRPEPDVELYVKRR